MTGRTGRRRVLPLEPVQGRGDRQPPPGVVDRLNALPIRTVEDVRARFPDVPVHEDRSEGHFSNLRLVTTSTCRMRCGYPGENTMWCHNEGMNRNQVPEADYDTMRGIVHHFQHERGIRQVTLAGLQPRLDNDLLRFVSDLRSDGIDHVSLVSHGLHLVPWMPRLREAGLSDVVLSIQAFERRAYADVMGVDAYRNALDVIDTGHRIGLPVTVNRVLLKGYSEDIPDFLVWARHRDLRVRLYDVLWMPNQDEQFLRNHVSWQSLTHLWAPHVERITVSTYGLPGRINIVHHLHGGGAVETNVNAPKLQHTAPVCLACPLRNACAEGWLGCGIRVSADYKITPCVLRPDLARSVLGEDGDYLDPSAMTSYLSGETHDPADR